MHLLMVRHGQSNGNIGVPEPDPSLTEIGHQQADLAGKAMPNGRRMPSSDYDLASVDEILASPMRRSIQTAMHIDEYLKVGVTVHPRLHECCGPQPPDMAKAGVAERFPTVKFHESMPEGAWWPAENEDRFDGAFRSTRVAAWFQETYGDTDKVVVYCGHGTFNGFLVNAFMGTPVTDLRYIAQNNTGITRFIIKPDSIKLVYMNDVTHLPESLWT